MDDDAFSRGNDLAAAGRCDEAVAAFTLCLERSPDDWQAMCNRGNAWMQLKRYDRAMDDYMAAAALAPDATSVKTNLGVLLKELGQLDLAAKMLTESLQHDPSQADAWSNLGVVRQYGLRYGEAVDCHLRAIDIAGASVARLNNLGNALCCALRLDEAVAAYRTGLELEPADDNLRFNLSIALFLQGDYHAAWPMYESRWGAVLKSRYSGRRWLGEPLGGRRLLLWSEQGLGDSLQMVRFLAALRLREPQAVIRLACPRTFWRLFSTLPVQCVEEEQADEAFDLHLPLMSLPGLLDVGIEQVPQAPYLHAPDEVAASMAAALPARRDGRPRVGLVWESGAWGVGIADHGRQNKSISPDIFSALLDVEGIDFVSLQLGELPPSLRGRLAAPAIGDFADTAAIVEQLDLVISVDTSVVHLAGALGCPVWVMMRAESAPFFLARGEDSPWYPSMRILRQSQAGEWRELLDSACRRLLEWRTTWQGGAVVLR
ncbi:tetratricopeptide repeat protein [Paludibacterium yongneupense]|uniref:tetratricopeptide repeat-containing glycosyltransferase family protein n=1 Tax=Paludibacterium yongneupense TaxID=400061 RepID=UPI000401CBB7|nr:tetratricopeptide repeat-containing glycosyltransferase family protein [Paludibacterium yongneupense]